MKIVTAAQMRAMDNDVIRKFHISEKRLIFNAGRAAAEWILEKFNQTSRRVLVLVGRGNNGADALVTASFLRRWGFCVNVIRIWHPRALGVLQKALSSRKGLLLVDGMFGTGLNRPIIGSYRDIVEKIDRSGVEVVALDIPSGLHADTGRPQGVAIRADHTLTFELPKLGLVQERAADFVGRLYVLPIGFPKECLARLKSPWELITPISVASYFRKRLCSSHKMSVGRVLVLGGGVGMAGAPALAARAALRAGAGMVTLLVPSAIYALSARLAGAEVMTHPATRRKARGWTADAFDKVRELWKRSDVLVMGPGMPEHASNRSFLRRVLRQCPLPMVLDAGALNLIASDLSMLRVIKTSAILTPHPGEMGRLAGMSTKRVQSDRFRVAGAFSKKYWVTVVLKGSRSIVASPDGRFGVQALGGNPGMATAGCGDALAGVLGALVARGISSQEAARAGVYLHARAGDAALSSHGGGIVSDLIKALPDEMRSLANS